MAIDKVNSQVSDDNDYDSESEIIHIDPSDIFHADRSTVYVRLMLGLFYLLCGFGIISLGIFWLPPNGTRLFSWFLSVGIVLIVISITYCISAWHKRSYRSFINEQGIGTSNRHRIPAHAWSEVDYVLQRLYYRGTPPNNGVWGVAPRRLDEDYIIVLKSGQRLFFGRRNLGHLSRFKPLILYYSEQNNVEWKTQEIYHSRKIKAGTQLVPTLLLFAQVLFPLLLLGVLFIFMFTDKTINGYNPEARFSWPIEFITREAQDINKVSNKGSVTPLNVQISSMYITEDGKEVAFGTVDGSFQLRDIATGAERGSLTNALLSAVVFTMTSHDNTKVILRDFDNQLSVWDLNKGKEIFPLDVPNRYYHSVVFSADGKSLFFGDLKGRIAEFDMISDLPKRTFQVLQNPITYLQISVDGQRLLAGYENNSVYIWNLFMDSDPISLNLDSELICAEFTQNNAELGTLEKNGTFRIWNYSIRQETSRLALYISEKEKINVFSFSHSGKIIAYGSSLGNVIIRSITETSSTEKLTVPGMKEPVPILDLKFSEDDNYLFVGTEYGIWKIRVNVSSNE